MVRCDEFLTSIDIDMKRYFRDGNVPAFAFKLPLVSIRDVARCSLGLIDIVVYSIPGHSVSGVLVRVGRYVDQDALCCFGRAHGMDWGW